MFKYRTIKLLSLIFVFYIDLFISINIAAASPTPLDGSGNAVDWWVILKMPKLGSNDLSCDGTNYFFASNSSEKPTYQLKQDKVTPKSLNDIDGNPIAKTLQCMFDAMNNKLGSVSYILYNDEKAKTATDSDDEEILSGVELYDTTITPLEASSMYPTGKTPPDYSQYGHLKGMLVWDNNYGYWLIHSAPQFVFTSQKPGQYNYKYPENAVIKGQSFICFSFKTNDSLEIIANQLIYDKPLVLQSYISDNSKPWSAAVSSIINKEWNKEAPDLWKEKKMTWDNLDSGSKTANIKTVDNVSLVSFAKNNYWNNDLYSYQVAPYLRVPLYVETWRCGCTLPNFYKNVPPKAIHDNQMVDISIWKNKQAVKIGASGYCSRYNNLKYPYPPYDTINVTGITIKVSIINKIFKYKYTNDHSKWAISQDKRYPWVFIGDINRQGPHSQWVRGGGGIAIENTSLWSFFKEIISDTEPQSIIL